MNEITRIHLAKTPYNVEIEAKNELEKYLTAITKQMQADEDVQREIESRMVELLAERGVAADQVISSDDIEALREQLGEPKDFSSSDDAADEVEITETGEKPPKRFMRDTNNAVLGGVCAGLAEYFRIDVLIVRLITLAAVVLSAGAMVLVYIIFWIITPPARTKADRLMMAGKPVTLEALKDSVENDKPASPAPLLKIGRILLGVFGAIVTAGVMVGVIIGGIIGYDTVSAMSDFQSQPMAVAMLVSLFAGGVALVILLGLLSASAFQGRISRAAGLAMVVSLLVGVFATAGIAVSGFQLKETAPSDLQRLTKTESIVLPSDISGISDATVTNGTLRYIEDDTKTIRAEVEYLAISGNAKPEVVVTRDGDTLVFTVKESHPQKCLKMIYNGSCNGRDVAINVYGLNDYLHSEYIDN